MTERQLVRAMAVGRLRLRLNASMCWAAFALLLVTGLASVGVLLARMWPEWTSFLLVGAWSLPVIAVLLTVLGFRWCRPAVPDVALKLDRAAGLKEHLTTWAENRGRPVPADPVAHSFVSLQRSATLREARGLRPWRLLPLVLPGWTRVIWLGLMALGCALLMPEQRADADRVLGMRADRNPALTRGGQATGKLDSDDLPETFQRIEILSPAEMHTLTAMVSGPDVPDEIKEEALQDLEAKLGTLSEAELSPDVRSLLSELRKQVRGEEGAASENGSVVANGKDPTDSTSTPVNGGGPNAFNPQEAVTVARTQFPDVASALERYYLAGE